MSGACLEVVRAKVLHWSALAERGLWGGHRTTFERVASKLSTRVGLCSRETSTFHQASARVQEEDIAGPMPLDPPMQRQHLSKLAGLMDEHLDIQALVQIAGSAKVRQGRRGGQADVGVCTASRSGRCRVQEMPAPGQLS